MKRRDFSKTSIAGLAAGLAVCGESTGKDVEIKPVKKEAPKPYGIQYYDKACEIWDRISTSELPLITQAADHAASSLKNGKKLYCLITGGHMHKAELRQDRPGNPDYLHLWKRDVKPEQFDVIGKGDFILFDSPFEHIKRVHDRGAFSVGIRVPYFPNKTTPKGVLAINELATNAVFENVILAEECSDIILTSGVPFTDGVLNIPEIPTARACPMSPQGTFNFFWMITAEIAMRDKGGGAMGSSEKAAEYIELIKKRGVEIQADFNNIDTIAQFMVECVSRGGKYWNYTFSDGDPIMERENIHRCSGVVMSWGLNPKDIPKEGKAGDFVIIAGEASDIKENIEAARTFKKAGIKVIYIGPAKTEGSSGNDLPTIADWHIDTHSPERDGALIVPGFDKKICPTTGLLYPLAQYMLNSQFITHMIEIDMTPLVDMGSHVIGGDVYSNLLYTIVAKRGY